MVSRLVLGCEGGSRAVVDALTQRRGELAVVDDDQSRVNALREEGVRAELEDPADPDVLAAHDPDVVFVGVEQPAKGLGVLRAARDAFPDAYVVAYLGTEVDAGLRANAREMADEVVTPGAALVGEVLDVVESEAGVRARRLRRTLQAIEGPLAVVMHDNPDPDAIASAVALRELAAAFGVEATACYYGEISHQENRAMVNLLDLRLRRLDPDDGIDEFESVALVDHSRPGVNDQLPPDRRVDVVIDHHPPRAPVEAGFIDLRHGLGATSTLLVDYFERLGVPLPPPTATALLYGIRVDTDDFVREVSTEDFEAAAVLLESADLDVLDRIENPSTSAETMEVIARAIRERRIEGPVLATYVGELSDRDALAQAADMLLGMDDVSTTMVVGRMEGTAYVSARARGADLDLGETLRVAFDRIGSAGGHADMAGAQIPLTAIDAMDAGDDPDAAIRENVVGRFFEVLGELPSTVRDRGPVGSGPREYGTLPFEGEHES